jgi:hypothetical protein
LTASRSLTAAPLAPFDELRGLSHASILCVRKAGEQRRQLLDAAFAAVLHHRDALCGRVEPVHPASAASRSGGRDRRLEGLDDARHRRRPYLLRGSQLAERPRAAEDEDGERRELRRRDTRRRILAADVPEGMNCGRVEAVRGFD